MNISPKKIRKNVNFSEQSLFSFPGVFFLSKAFLSSERVGKLRANAIVAAKEGDGLLQSSNEGWTNCVTQGSKPKATQPHGQPDHPLLKAPVRPPFDRHGQLAAPGIVGGASGDAESSGTLQDFPKLVIKPLSHWLDN